MESIDEAKILRGNDIVINDVITIRQPSLDEIVDYGERKFFSTFYSFCAIPSDMKSMLDDIGLDFMKVTDWQLFIMLTRNMPLEETSIIIPNIDFSKLELMQVNDTEEVVLADDTVIITEAIYNDFIPYVRMMIGYVLKREKAANKFTKQILIDEERYKRSLSKDKKYESTLNSMILTLVNTEEFTYTYKNVYEITFFQLLKSFVQIQKKKAACSLYQGMMSGFMDTSKIKRKDYTWIYEEAEQEQPKKKAKPKSEE